MSSLVVLVIRHGEKPDAGIAGPGLDETGTQDDKSLLVRGWQRAGTWAALLGSGFGGNDYPRPDIIYAANPDRPGDDGKVASRRPLETILPLAARLNIRPRTNWRKDDVEPLAAEIRALTGVVLVSWEHKRILPRPEPGSDGGRWANVAESLLAGQAMPHLPASWKGSRFDVVLRFDRSVPQAPWSFRQLSPRLLGGDTDRPVDQDNP